MTLFWPLAADVIEFDHCWLVLLTRVGVDLGWLVALLSSCWALVLTMFGLVGSRWRWFWMGGLSDWR